MIDFNNSSIYYTYPIINTKPSVNNNKISNKISIERLHNQYKITNFVVDKGTFVLLTIKKLILWL